MREKRSDVFHETTGVLMEDGKKWHDIRSKVQQDLMRPKSAHFYIDDIQKISQDFIDYIKLTRSVNDKTIENFLPEIYRFTFETISFIAMDVRLGCLQKNIDPELARVFQATKEFLGTYI